MDASQIAVLHLVSAALFDVELDQTKLKDVEWPKVFSLACSHGVAAICFDALERLPNPLRPERMLLLQWMGVVNKVENDFLEKKRVLDEVVQHMERSGICVYLLKGQSLSRYYPNPLRRVSSDLDIYLGKDFEEGNSLLESIGARRVEAYHRHVSYVYNGVAIENHCMLSDTKGRKDHVKLEKKLVEIAGDEMNGRSGLVYPSNRFSTLFVSWHNESHFMFEGLTLRHLCDWALLLRCGFQDVDMEEFLQIKRSSSFGKLIDVLTAIVIRYFEVPVESLPIALVESAQQIPTKLSEKVMNDVLSASEDSMINRHRSPIKIKIDLARKILKDKWKFNEVFEMSVWKVLIPKVLSSFEG